MKTVFTLPSGEKLTKDKFLKYFERKVRKTTRTNKMIEKGDKILVACSGGKDSTVALYLLSKIVKEARAEVEAFFIDVEIGEYSKINQKNIRKFCKDNGIKLHETSFKKEFGYGVCYIRDSLREKDIKWKSCTICGIMKRYILNKYAKTLKATKLATGHNLDDEAQSIIMNMFKNSAKVLPRLGPVTGIKAQKGFIPRIKPLYFCTEEESKLFSNLLNFPVLYDECPCRVDAYRRQVGIMLDDFDKHHSGTKNGIVNSFLEILPSLKSKYKGEVKVCKKCGEPSANDVCNTCNLLSKIIG
ncbi:MAG: TIGR00269 family protein [Nanoarchaeota archaeon]|nr:TIGR00269 family protein [Nanoarchaeota archaeon]